VSDVESRAGSGNGGHGGPAGVAGTCSRCGDLQYVTAAEGDRATARVCECAAVCTRCGGVGHLPDTDADGYVVVRACRCSHLHERVALFNAAGLPARYHKKTIEGYQHAGGNQNEVRYALLNYRRTYRAGQRGVLLMGAPGTGKTHLLVALLAYLSLERGYRCRFVDFMTLLSELKDGYNSNRSEAQLIGPLVRVPILAIDELGKTTTRSPPCSPRITRWSPTPRRRASAAGWCSAPPRTWRRCSARRPSRSGSGSASTAGSGRCAGPSRSGARTTSAPACWRARPCGGRGRSRSSREGTRAGRPRGAQPGMTVSRYSAKR